VVTLGNGVTEKDLLVHDAQHPNPAYAFLLSRMDGRPGQAPVFEQEMNAQLTRVQGNAWQVRVR